MSTTLIVSPEVAKEMATILLEDEVREVHYEETQAIANQIRMSLPRTFTPKELEICGAGPCC
jgi:hypothetical protein